jgi:hypothetical protein
MIARPPISQNGGGKKKKKEAKERNKEKVFLSKKTRGVSHCGLAI